MPINRGMDKEDVVYRYNGILLSHKKEQNCALCRNVDGPRDCHTKREKKNHILYVESRKMMLMNIFCKVEIETQI